MKSLAKNIPEGATKMRSGVANHLPQALVALTALLPHRRQFAGTSLLIDFLQLALVVSRAIHAVRPLPGNVFSLFCLISFLFSDKNIRNQRPRRGAKEVASHGKTSHHFDDVRKYATKRDSPPSLSVFFIAAPNYHPVSSHNRADGHFFYS